MKNPLSSLVITCCLSLSPVLLGLSALSTPAVATRVAVGICRAISSTFPKL